MLSRIRSELKPFLDAASSHVARAIASLQRDAAAERALRDAEHAARLAQLDALIIATRAQHDAVAARLATLRDGTSVDLDDVRALVVELVDGGLPPLVVEAVAAIPRPADGKDADPEVIRTMVEEAVAAVPRPADGKDADPEVIRSMVEEAIAAIPRPSDGKDADPEVIRAMVEEAVAAIPKPADGKDADPEIIRTMIEEAVAAIPRPADGKDADPEVVRALVEEAVAAIPRPADGKDADPEVIKSLVEEAVAAIPRPADGRDGKDVDIEQVKAMVDEAVEVAVAAIPAPKDGKSVEPSEVEAIVAEAVASAVAEIPAPENGKDADPAVIRAMVEEAVAAIPKPKDGAPGVMPVAREWSDAVHYRGDVVTHCGATWQALRDTGREPPDQDWICLASAGLAARSFTIRGTWNAGETYGALDVVALNGASFAARRDDPGPCPGEGWQLLAAQGKSGKPGTGLKGPPGPRVVKMEIDGEGLLRLTNADGSHVECDLYPVLSKL